MDIDSRFRGNDRERNGNDIDGFGNGKGEDGDDRDGDGDDGEEDAADDDNKEDGKNDRMCLICPSNSSEHIPLFRVILVSINIPRATASPWLKS